MDSTAKERIRNICAELGEDLDSESCKALREFVKTCPTCEAFVDSVKKTIALYQNYLPQRSGERRQRLFRVLQIEDSKDSS